MEYELKFELSVKQEAILMERHQTYLRGEMKTYTVGKLKQRFNYSDDDIQFEWSWV